MMSKIWLVLWFWMMLQPIVALQAQTTRDVGTKAAVKLGSGATVKNTVVWDNDGQALSGVSSVASYLQGRDVNIPCFKDVVKGDFRLMQGSPCIDRGQGDDRLGAKDLWGNKRVINQVDIGAHEYTYYKVNFEKSEYIDVLPLKKSDDTFYDSLHIEPGDDFKFKLHLNFENVTTFWVSKVIIEQSKQEIQAEDNVYSIENINSDITVIIEVNPPISVGIEALEHGRVQVSAGGKVIPTVDGSGNEINALLVEENTLIRIDTISDEGYYCNKIWAKDGGETEIDMLSYAGDSTFLVNKEIKLGAEFLPLSYPVEVAWSAGGQVTVTNRTTGNTLFESMATSPQTVNVPYQTSLEVQAVPALGYMLDSVVVRRKTTGAEIIPGDRKSNLRTVDVEIGGIEIKVWFRRPECKVDWVDVTGGALLVQAGDRTLNPGDKVEQGTVILITPRPSDGYELQSLKVVPTGETEQSPVDNSNNTYSWTVEKDVMLRPVFKEKTFQVTFVTNTPSSIDNVWIKPTSRPYTAAYNADLDVEAIAAGGYRCDSITVNGVKRTAGGKTRLTDIIADKEVKAWFSRKPYLLHYSVSAGEGTVIVEVKDYGTSTWHTVNTGDAIYHFDELKITVTPAPGYETDQVLINGGVFSGREISVTGDQDISVRFKKQLFTVHLTKITTGVGVAPTNGILHLSDENGNVLATLSTNETEKDLLQVAYGTRLFVTMECDQGYSVTQLDTAVLGHTPGDILQKKSFFVTNETTVRAFIKQTQEFYTVSYEQIGCRAGDHGLTVMPVSGGAQNQYLSGTSLQINVTPVSGYTYYLYDQDGAQITSPHNLQKNIRITAKFIPLRTVRINPPEGMVIEVKRNGISLADGEQIPAGSSLTVKIKVKENERDSLRVLSLTVNGEEIWAYSEAVTIHPVESAEVNYTVPDDCELENLVFSGERAVYYRVVYSPAAHGELSITTPDEHLFYNNEYWLPAGTNLTVMAKPDEGFKYVGTYNKACIPPEQISLTDQGGQVYTSTYMLNKHMEIESEFTQVEIQVTLRIYPESGGGNVVVNDGTRDILTVDAASDFVNFGTNLKVNVTANEGNGYVLSSIKGGETVLGTTSGIGLRITKDTVITVTFGKRYKVIFNANELTVKQGTRILSNGDFVVSGSDLVVTYSGNLMDGIECKEINAVWSVTSSQQLLPSGNFTMPEADVTFNAETDRKQYVLNWTVQPGNVGASVTVWNKTQGNYVGNGDIVMHNDVLKTLVGLPEDALAQGNTRYYVDSLNYQDDVGYAGSLKNPNAAGGLTYQGREFTVKGNTTIAAQLKHKTKKLYIKIEPQDERFGVNVTMGGNTTHFEQNGSIDVPVGESFIADVVIPEDKEEGFELKSFPDNAKKLTTYSGGMSYDDITLRAVFGLKVFEILIDIVPENSGNVTVADNFGTLYGNHSPVKYSTVLQEIKAAPQTEYGRLKHLSAMMKGEEQFAGSASESYWIARVTDTVKIRAEFEPLCKVLTTSSDHGSISLICADTNAVGHYYPAETDLIIKLNPDKGYEVDELKVNNLQLPASAEGGEITYRIPSTAMGGELTFAVKYKLRQVNVRFITEGPGSLTVNGLPGGDQEYNQNNPNGVRNGMDYFTPLNLTVTPKAGNYKVRDFFIRTEDGQTHRVMTSDTLIRLEGNTVVEASFAKFYQILYEQPEHGTLNVSAGGDVVPNQTRCDGGQNINVQVLPAEGYELGALTWNENDVINHTIVLPVDAGYDVVEIRAALQVKKHTLTVVHPEGGSILVEKLGENGWESIDVGQSQQIDYWTRIRCVVNVSLPDKYIVQSLFVNELQPLQEQEEWTVKGDIVLTARIVPRTYAVTFDQPAKGTLTVEMLDGQNVESGSRWPYLTRLTVLVEPGDPEGYRVNSLTANGNEISDQAVWVLEDDTHFAASIVLNCWRVTSRKIGEGVLKLLREDGTELLSPEDSVGHYEKIRIVAEPEEGWMLYRLNVLGSDPDAVYTFSVMGDVDVVATFKETEPWTFPVIFTPNSDGINDFWEIGGLWQSPENALEIYNRLEQRVYKASPYQNDWNGTTDDGSVLPAGNYVYKFTLGSGKEYMGIVSIIRN